MNIQINTDKNISASDSLFDFVRDKVESSLSHYSDRVTTVEVHLGDENSHKESARDKRCMVEARLANLDPIAVTDQADTLEQAIAGAASKIKRAVGNTLGKMAK